MPCFTPPHASSAGTRHRARARARTALEIPQLVLHDLAVKVYTYQLLKAVDHMHRHGIFHRDIKPENMLIVDNTLKLADFGSCRGVYSKQPYTEYISTRWYRAPECLLTDGWYGLKMVRGVSSSDFGSTGLGCEDSGHPHPLWRDGFRLLMNATSIHTMFHAAERVRVLPSRAASCRTCGASAASYLRCLRCTRCFPARTRRIK